MRRVAIVPFRDGRPIGHVLNVLAFVPAGAIGVGLGWTAGRTLAAGAAVSGVTEFSQLFTRRRFASTTDLLLNTAGVVLGIALARRRARGQHASTTSSPAAPRRMRTPESSA